MQFIDVFYNVFVNRVPGIRERYKKSRSRVKGLGRALVWIYLLWLNVRYYVFHDRKLAHVEKYPYYEEKDLYSKGSESSISCKTTPETYADELAQFDVISFDVFDTLVLRPFSSPADLFFLLGDKLNYPDFQRIRQEMEWKAREKKYKKDKHYEVTLEEIYSLLSEETGIEKEKAMQLEIETEYTFCFANPFMYRVIEELRKRGKRLIVTSDMYLSTEQIRMLLERCGYPQFDSYYVSCDIAKSKSSGSLFDYVKAKEGQQLSFAHVGDNFIADVQQAKKFGFTPFHYVNVNAVGEPYRPYDMSVITGSIYRGLVNAHIHNGLSCYSREYEYGYIYGGLFVAGYCRFIHDYSVTHDVDKILFLARDGDILLKAYKLLYPDNPGGSCPHTQYVYWSRLAATKMAASYYKYDYFRRFLYHKVNQNYTIRQILAAMELEDMIPKLCRACSLSETTVLTDKNVDKVKKYLQYSWSQVLTHYEEQLAAGKQYYEKVLQGCKKAVAVDIGWAGSGAITLDYIVNQIWNLDCQIIGIIAGTNTCHNAEPDASETFLQSGKLVSYLYSQRENRDIWKLHDAGKGHNLLWELLLDAPTGSFKGFFLDTNGECMFRFKAPPPHRDEIMAIQQGILDFVSQYKEIMEKMDAMQCRFVRITGRDAYASMVNVLNGENGTFVKELKGMLDETNVE